MEIRWKNVETEEWGDFDFDPECPACPRCQTEMWDNRKNKKNPKGPDFKCREKSCAQAVWLPKPKTAPKPKPLKPKPPQEKPNETSTRTNWEIKNYRDQMGMCISYCKDLVVAGAFTDTVISKIISGAKKLTDAIYEKTAVKVEGGQAGGEFEAQIKQLSDDWEVDFGNQLASAKDKGELEAIGKKIASNTKLLIPARENLRKVYTDKKDWLEAEEKKGEDELPF